MPPGRSARPLGVPGDPAPCDSAPGGPAWRPGRVSGWSDDGGPGPLQYGARIPICRQESPRALRVLPAEVS